MERYRRLIQTSFITEPPTKLKEKVLQALLLLKTAVSFFFSIKYEHADGPLQRIVYTKAL